MISLPGCGKESEHLCIEEQEGWNKPCGSFCLSCGKTHFCLRCQALAECREEIRKALQRFTSSILSSELSGLNKAIVFSKLSILKDELLRGEK